MNFTLPRRVHCRTSWTSAWMKGESRGRTRARARLAANQWEVLPWRGQRVDVRRPDGTRDTGWGYPWWDSRGDVKTVGMRVADCWFDLVWDGCCCSLLHCIYRPFPPIPPRLCLCSLPLRPPLPSVTSHAHLHSDSANRLIFLEQWCQLFIPSSPSLFHPSDCDWLSLSPFLPLSPTLSLPSPSHEVTLAQSTADAPILIPQEMPPSGSLCVFVWGRAARALACGALSARSFRFVWRMDVSLNGNWWVCMGQH